MRRTAQLRSTSDEVTSALVAGPQLSTTPPRSISDPSGRRGGAELAQDGGNARTDPHVVQQQRVVSGDSSWSQCLGDRGQEPRSKAFSVHALRRRAARCSKSDRSGVSSWPRLGAPAISCFVALLAHAVSPATRSITEGDRLMVGRRLIPVQFLGIALAGAMGIPATGATGSTPTAASSTSAASESVLTRQQRAVPQPIAVHEGPSDRKRVALTFDADMTPDMRQRLDSGEVRTWYNDNVIDVLRQTGTPATLFLTGLWAQTYPQVAKSLGDDPLFEIANHSLEHKAFRPCYTLPALREEEKFAAVSDSEKIIEQITGERPYYFRFPGGSIKCARQRDVALIAALGEQAVDWTAAGDAYQPDPQAVVDSVMANIRPGAIVALHMHGSDETSNAPATDEAIALLIPELQSQGYELVTLGQLLKQ